MRYCALIEVSFFYSICCLTRDIGHTHALHYWIELCQTNVRTESAIAHGSRKMNFAQSYIQRFAQRQEPWCRLNKCPELLAPRSPAEVGNGNGGNKRLGQRLGKTAYILRVIMNVAKKEQRHMPALFGNELGKIFAEVILSSLANLAFH